MNFFWAPKEDRNLTIERAELALEIAKNQIGLGEELGRNNWGPNVWKFANPYGTPRLDWRKTSGPWCAAFVCWCREAASYELGIKMPKRTHNAKKLMATMTQIDHPVPGCCFGLHRGARNSGKGHIGFWDRTHELVDDPLIMSWIVDGNIGRYPAPVRARVIRPDDDPNFIGWFL